MRRQNSEFLTAFRSHQGKHIYNNDYFGYAELPDFACYVLADGLTEGSAPSPAAQEAVGAAITAFTERPSLSAGAMKHYLRSAHNALLHSPHRQRWQASIMIVVTDYRKVRYAHAGNARFALYRNGQTHEESIDHSLSAQLAQKGEIPKDKIARHTERHNLSRYLGKTNGFEPAVSAKISLKEGDVFSLYTRGIWEKCDQSDLRVSAAAKEGTPEAAVEWLERMALDLRSEENWDNYTIAFVFVNKIFQDPEAGKKRRTIIIASVAAVLVIAVIAVILVIRHNIRAEKMESLEIAYTDSIEQIEDEDFAGAQKSIEKAYGLAEELKDKEKRAYISDMEKLTNAITRADEKFEAKEFLDAQELYDVALTRSRFTSNLGKRYIEQKLDECLNYIIFEDTLYLADTYADDGRYDDAEKRYLEARRLASAIHYTEGRENAQRALDALHETTNAMRETMESDQAARDEEMADRVAQIKEAAEFELSGDLALQDGDAARALMLYKIAGERFTELADESSAARTEEKINNMDAVIRAADAQEARTLETAADALADAGNYSGARVLYIMARNAYSRAEETQATQTLQAKLDDLASKEAGNGAGNGAGETERNTENSIVPDAPPMAGN
jgi:serine/threonine protein phosphatase PrpC